MLNSRAIPGILIFSVLIGCVDKDATARLESEIKDSEAAISSTENEITRYGEGSVLRTLTQARLSVQKQTLDMLRQKRAAALYYPRFSYVADGTKYEAPADVDARIKSLDERRVATGAQIRAAEERAKSSGLLGSIAAATEASTLRISLAQIDHLRTAYEAGFPPFFAYDPNAKPLAAEGAPPPASSGPGRAETAVPPPPERNVEAETMARVLDVQLKSKKYYPQDFAARRYKAALGFKFAYANRSEKDIRAFTGAVVFRDIFDRDILRVNLTVDDPIAAGATKIDDDKSLDVNEFNDAHERVVNTEMENLKVSFETTSIMFSDGSRMGSVTP